LPKKVIIIIDEVHRCSNDKSLHGKLLLSFKKIYTQENPLLLLSATITTDKNKFIPFGIL
jgi:type I site-specific restriction-modification system R (restriction) subunit